MPQNGQSVTVAELQRIAAKRRRRYLVAVVIGIPLVPVGAVMAEQGTGEGPREVWFSTASWVDWVGGLLVVGGALLVTFGWFGRRNGWHPSLPIGGAMEAGWAEWDA